MGSGLGQYERMYKKSDWQQRTWDDNGSEMRAREWEEGEVVKSRLQALRLVCSIIVGVTLMRLGVKQAELREV